MILDRADGRECQSYDPGRFFRQSRVARCGGTERTVGMVTLRDMLGTAPQGRKRLNVP
ncbi:MAG: hypothetical protein ABJG15_01990 [Hyphomonadaceae bacterium]